MSKDNDSSSGDERRIHPRIEVSTIVHVSGSDGTRLEGTLMDLSKGGLGLFLSKAAGLVGDNIEIFLPLPGDVEITVTAELLRMENTEKGIFHAFRHSMIEPALQEKLLSLIETLLDGAGGKRRQHPRISRRLPIRYGRLAELEAILENISMGGLAMTVSSPLVLFEDVEVSIPDVNGKEFLIVTGRVVHQHAQDEDGKPNYRVGLEFKELKPVVRNCLKELLNHILEIRSQKE